MSNRDSLGFGEMVPQDVVDIFAQEKQNKASRKSRSRSLGRAFGWLKGRKKKDQGGDRQNSGLSPALDLAQPAGHKGGHKSGKHSNAHGNSHGPKRDGDDDDKTLAPPLLQENVFIESSRPKYLEDLHTEALEGLKMMQQEETSTGVEHQDNMSTISTLSVQTDGEGCGFTTDSTIADSSSVVSVQSSVSTKSSRSGLTRQGSTFRPLNSGKKPEKSKSRKRHRKTVVGIPQHVQRELGLDRVGWVMPPKLDEEECYNGESDYSTTSDGTLGPDSPDGPGTSPEATNLIHPLSKDKVAMLNASHTGPADHLALFHHLDPGSTAEQRQQHLSVPWKSSASSLQQEPPSPVMSMSPQAAYMSKIIPNAVLPPSIDVVEISRGRSRNSVRTVSKSSLVMSSPAPSRASSRASSTRGSSVASASRQNPPNLSDSNWSNSDSSGTLVSDSSTISNSSTPSQRRSHNGDAHEEKVSLRSNGRINIRGDDAKKDGQFGRSLSVMKAKRAPPPPSRSYSLHNKMKRRSRDLAEVRVIPGELSLKNISGQCEEKQADKPGLVESPGYHGDTSSLEDSTGSGSPSPNKALNTGLGAKDPGTWKQENKLNVISPSSGYSSQDATSPQPSKLPVSSSPKHKKGFFAKLQRIFPGSSSPTPAAPKAEAAENTKTDTVDTINPSVQALRELFNIPRHPKVHAPPPPPPEVWAHSKRSFELLLGPPAPENLYAIIKKNPKDRRQQRLSPASTERKLTMEVVNVSPHVQEGKKVQESSILMAEIHKENNERLAPNVELKESNNEKVRGSDILNGMLAKAVEKRKERLALKREEENNKASIQTTSVETLPDISLVRVSPSPSPNVGHRPIPPPTAQTTAVGSPEYSWPPPPPPILQVSPPDELDFTLPPPPLFAEGASVLPVQVPPNGMSQVTVEPPLNIPPPPSYAAPPPPAAVSPLVINKFHHSPKTNALPVIEEIVSPPVPPPPPNIFFQTPEDPPVVQNTVVSQPVQEIIDVSILPPDNIPPPPPQSVSRLAPPQSIPPPPPLPPQLSQININAPQESVSLSADNQPSDGPPESIPPPPPLEHLHQAAASPPSEVSVLGASPLPATPPPVASLEKALTPAVAEESSPMVTPSLLQMVKLRSVNSSPEPPQAEEPAKVEVIMRKKLPSNNVSTSSSSGEAPQKPIRRSLIVSSPTSTSPPVIVASQPPVTITSAPSSTTESSIEVSPPAPITTTVVAPPASSEVTSGETIPAAASSAPSTTDSSVEKCPPVTADVISVVTPLVSSTITSVETSPVTTTTSVLTQATSTIDSSVAKSPPTAANVPPPASTTTVVSSMEKSPPPAVEDPGTRKEDKEASADVAVVIPPIAPPTVKSEESSPEATVAAPPSSIVIPIVEKASPSPTGAPSTSASTVISVETSLPAHTAAPVAIPPSSTVIPPVENAFPAPTTAPVTPSAAVISTVEKSPSASTATPIAPPHSAAVIPPLENASPAPTTPPPASASTDISIETSPPLPTVALPSSTLTLAVENATPAPTAAPVAAPPSSSVASLTEKSPAMTVVPPVVISPASTTTVVPPVKKSPSAVTTPHSMNLQEAIRLRTAARSKEAPASRLSLHSPTSPKDFRTSPTTTANFIFSKSNKKVIIESKPKSEVKGDNQSSPQLSPVAKAANDKKGGKVPPPVAKKPKSKEKEVEASEGTEAIAEEETIKDGAEKSNGTAGSVEGGATT